MLLLLVMFVLYCYCFFAVDVFTALVVTAVFAFCELKQFFAADNRLAPFMLLIDCSKNVF